MPDSQTQTPELSELYSRHSSKWRRFNADVLPMHVAEMDFAIAEPVRELIARMAHESDLGYLGPVPEVARAFEGFARDRWGWQIHKAELKIATDVGVATVEYLRANLEPGARVIVNSPVYSGFYEWLKELKIEPVDVPLAHTEAGWRLDLEGLEQAFKAGHLTLLLCNPHNPVGRAFDRDELTALAALAKRYDATVISDEIHAPLTYGEFTPYLSCGPDAEDTGVVITSSSKSFNLAGLKAALLITQGLRMAACAVARHHGGHPRRKPPPPQSRARALATRCWFRTARVWLSCLARFFKGGCHDRPHLRRSQGCARSGARHGWRALRPLGATELWHEQRNHHRRFRANRTHSLGRESGRRPTRAQPKHARSMA